MWATPMWAQRLHGCWTEELAQAFTGAAAIEQPPVRILLADGQSRVRSALRLLIEQETGAEIIGEATRAHELLQLLSRDKPDVLLLDWSLPGLHPTQSIALLKSCYPSLRIITLSGQPDVRAEATEAGVDAFICKGEAPQAVLATIHRFSGD